MDRDAIIILLQNKLKACADVVEEDLDDIDWGRHNGREELLEELIVEIGNKSSGI